MRKKIHPCLESRLTIHTNGATYLYGIPSLALWAALSGAAWRMLQLGAPAGGLRCSEGSRNSGGASAIAFDQMITLSKTSENQIISPTDTTKGTHFQGCNKYQIASW